MNIGEFQFQLFETALNEGFTDVEMYYEKKEVFGCQVYKGEIDHYEIAEDGGISFRGLIEGKMGYAYSEKIDDDSIRFLVQHAKENAVILQEDGLEEIFEGSNSYEKGDFFSNSLNETTIPEKIQFIKEVENKVLSYDPRIKTTDYCRIQSETITRKIFNNKGLSLSDQMNYLYVYVSVVAKEGNETKTGVGFEITKDFHSLQADKIAEKAANEALSQLGSKNIESKSYPVLLKNDAAANFLSVFVPNFSAENTQAGLSVLKDKLGMKIASDKVSIIDDPFLEKGLASRTFDSEGVASKPLNLVESGVLRSFLHNLKTAKKDQVVTTGHAKKDSYKGSVKVGPSNLYIKPSTISFKELVNDMKEGVFITELSGLHSGVNTVSGDFSVAANGFYIKDGAIQYPVNLMTIAGNFYELLNDVDAVGADLNFPLNNIGSPSLCIKSLSVTVE
ncbi:TldD/PmbA family protein [Heyndrickxia oleronia]|uniref:Peptidase U62 n=1 Tax=Heyndrickxia oleronia TaxID=38875 RepID=A0A8E2I4S7_9BACI|nr:TldD/PmbA family protein [Heyndrickxia oleronia]MEC1374225.1 TldD/PmbA family protein [Heyndrickxia oleronia]OOP66704.1 peptidase U62 [Heyndrickxia oleronia]QQZ07176.1 TldD/PmbA family protein [Heyndrickxia oleronia]